MGGPIKRDEAARTGLNETRQTPFQIERTLQNFASYKRKYERYMHLAGEAAAGGDIVEAENLFQHAEHFLRQMQN